MGQNWGPERRVAVSGRAGQGRASPALAPPAGVPETRERAVAVAAGAILRVPLLRCYSATPPLLRCYSVTAVTPPSLHCYSTITLLSLHRYSAVTPPLLCCYYTITLLLLHRYSAVTPLLLHMGSAQVCANTRVPEVSWPGGRTSTLALLPCLLKSRTQHVLGVFCLFFVLGCVFALVAYLFPFLNSKFASKQENNRKTGTSCLYCLNRPSPPERHTCVPGCHLCTGSAPGPSPSPGPGSRGHTAAQPRGSRSVRSCSPTSTLLSGTSGDPVVWTCSHPWTACVRPTPTTTT